MMNEIPKIIHYCWFGGNPKPVSVIKCIESWKKYCPEYQIIEWNELNFDVLAHLYTSQAFSLKKWAFISDYARLYIIYNNGGIYLDTDVELLKSLDPLLSHSAYAGFEDGKLVATGLGMGAIPRQEMIYKLLKSYDSISLLDEKGELNLVSCPILNTHVMLEHGLLQNNKKQTINGLTVFPKEFFSPIDYYTGRCTITKNTYSIHHFEASWKTKREKIKMRFRKKIGKNNVSILLAIKNKVSNIK